METDGSDAARVRRGRPRDAEVPARIREAAVRLFGAHGYSGTSVRAIAAAAGTDPALVLRHFESKERLFLQTMVVDYGSRDLVDGPLDGLGRALLGRLFEDTDPTLPSVFRALSRATDREEVRAYLEQTMQRHIVAPLTQRLSGADAEVRARLVGAILSGLLASLWVTEDPVLVAPPLGEVLDVAAAAVQALIDGAA